jgi:hypothetical protein
MIKDKDLTGNRFGKLVAIENLGLNKFGITSWRCVCDCGNKIIVDVYKLINKKRSCGCEKRKIKNDYTGKIFGNWKVLKFDSKKNRYNFWLCRCVCGTERSVNGTSLKNGTSKSCGCTSLKDMSSKVYEEGEVFINEMYYDYKYNAKKRNLSFNLDKSFFMEIISMPCYYCGIKPSYRNQKSTYKKVRTTRKKNPSGIECNGIDRINTLIGYEKNNVVPCCSFCNYLKKRVSEKEFYENIKRIYEFSLINNRI